MKKILLTTLIFLSLSFLIGAGICCHDEHHHDDTISHEKDVSNNHSTNNNETDNNPSECLDSLCNHNAPVIFQKLVSKLSPIAYQLIQLPKDTTIDKPSSYSSSLFRPPII